MSPPQPGPSCTSLCAAAGMRPCFRAAATLVRPSCAAAYRAGEILAHRCPQHATTSAPSTGACVVRAPLWLRASRLLPSLVAATCGTPRRHFVCVSAADLTPPLAPPLWLWRAPGTFYSPGCTACTVARLPGMRAASRRFFLRVFGTLHLQSAGGSRWLWPSYPHPPTTPSRRDAAPRAASLPELPRLLLRHKVREGTPGP